MVSLFAVDQLRGDPDLVADGADAPLDKASDSQLGSDLLDLLLTPLESE